MSAERRGCGQIVRCRDCKFGEVVPSTMFCRLLYEKPDWGLPEHYAGSEPCEHLEVGPDDFCAWGREEAGVVSHGRHHRRRRTARKRRMCSEKTRFACEMAAMRAGARLGMDWYRCPYCGGYHLTSKNRMKGTES